jgi:hypothetical protein
VCFKDVLTELGLALGCMGFCGGCMSHKFDPKSMTDMNLTYEGLCLSTYIRTMKSKIAKKKAELEAEENTLNGITRDLEVVNRELQDRKYHDIGHARCQFECPMVDGKHVVLTPEQLDPAVAAHLERRKLFE